MAITTITPPTGPQARQRLLAERLQELLRQEHAALVDDDVAAVARLTAAKEQVLGDLSDALGGDRTERGVPRAQSARRDPILHQALREAAAANAINAQFVATRLAYVRARFAGLVQAGYMARAAVDSAGLYKADGFTGGTRHYGAYGRA